MPKSPYERGRAAEYAIERKLEGMGYKWQIRSAASRGPIDLLASNGNQVLAVQVKGGSSPYVAKSTKEGLIEWAKIFKGRPVLAKKRRGRWQLQELVTV